MNPRSSICNVGSRTSSGESDQESYLIEEKLQKLLTHAGKQDGPKNIFHRIQEVPRLRRSIMARAVQNFYCSTPMPTDKERVHEDACLNISPINSTSEEVDPKEDKKSEDSEKNQELPNELKQPANRNSIVTVSDSEDEEVEQNEPGNKTRHAEVVNCTVDECNKKSNNSRDTSISATLKAKNQIRNTIKSKHVTSLGSEAVNKNVSGPKSSKIIADDQTNVNLLPGRLLRSQNCTSIEDNHTYVAPPNLRKNKKNFKKNKTQNDGTDFSQKNIIESLPGVSKSRKEAAVEKIISPEKTFIDEENETSVKENSHQTNVAQIIPTKHITEGTKVTKKLEERSQIPPRKLLFTSKESPDNLIAEKNQKTCVPVTEPVVILSRIPLARSRSKSKEKIVLNKETNSLDSQDCNEHVRITENSGHLVKSPPKRPPRKKRIPKETKTGNVPKIDVKDPVSTDVAEVPLKKNHIEKSVDPLKLNTTQNEKSEKKRDNQIKSREENKLVETGTSPIRIFNKNVKKHAEDKELTKFKSFNHDRDMFLALNESKAQKLDEIALKIQMINKEVQTSAKSTRKNRTKHSRKALTFDRNNSNQSSSTDSSTIIQNFEDERIVLFQTLEPKDLSINFSSSDDEPFEDTLCIDEENRPWRLDENLQIFPRRSSCKLNFLRTAQEIELEKELEKLDQSNNTSDNREKISIPLPQSGVQDCTKKSRLQVYSRATLHNNNSNISQTTRLQPFESDKVETSLIINQISNKEGPKISEIKTRSKYLQVETQTLDARRTKSPDLVVMQPISEQEQTITDCNGGKNRVINTRGKANKKDHEEVLAVPLDSTNPHPTSTKSLQVETQTLDARRTKSPDLVVMQPISQQEQTITDCNGEKNRVINTRGKTYKKDHEEVLAVPLDSTNPHPTSTIKKTNKKQNKARVPRSTNKMGKSNTNNRVLRSNRKTFDKPLDEVQQVDVLAAPLERSIPHLTCTDSISVGATDNNEENSVSEIRNNIEKSHSRSAKKQTSNVELNHARTSDIVTNVDCVQDEVPDTSPPVQEASLNMSQPTNIAQNQMIPPTSVNNEDRPSSFKSPKKVAKTSKPRRKKVISENDEGVSSTTMDPEDVTGVRRSRRERKVIERNFGGRLAIYSERDYFFFNGLSKITDTVLSESTKPKRKKKDSTENKKSEGVSAKKGKRGKKDIEKPQVSRLNRRKKQSNDETSSNSLGNDQAEDNINSNNMESNVNMANEINHTPKRSVNVTLAAAKKHSHNEDPLSQIVTPPKKSRTTDTERDFQENNNITKNKKSEGVSAEKGKRGKKVIKKPQVSSQNRRQKQSNDETSSNSHGNDQAVDNINSNNMESNVNIADGINRTPKRSVNNMIVAAARKNSRIEDPVSQNVTPPKKSRTTDTRRDFQENNTSINTKSPVCLNNADRNHTETDNNINAYGTNDIEENLNHEDFVPPSMLPQGGNRQVDRDSGRSTMLRSTFEESSVRITKPLTGRITKSHKKKNNICTKISKVLSRSINTSKEQQILNRRDTDTAVSLKAVNIAQDVASRRSSIVRSIPSNGEYINLMSDVNVISMRYIDTLPKFKLVKDNLLVTEGLRNLKDGGTMGYLKLLPAGQKSLHVARKFALFYFVMEGEGFLQVHNKTSSINKYSTFLIPLGVEYSITNTSKVDELFLGFVKMSSREDS